MSEIKPTYFCAQFIGNKKVSGNIWCFGDPDVLDNPVIVAKQSSNNLINYLVGSKYKALIVNSESPFSHATNFLRALHRIYPMKVYVVGTGLPVNMYKNSCFCEIHADDRKLILGNRHFIFPNKGNILYDEYAICNDEPNMQCYRPNKQYTIKRSNFVIKGYRAIFDLLNLPKFKCVMENGRIWINRLNLCEDIASWARNNYIDYLLQMMDFGCLLRTLYLLCSKDYNGLVPKNIDELLSSYYFYSPLATYPVSNFASRLLNDPNYNYNDYIDVLDFISKISFHSNPNYKLIEILSTALRINEELLGSIANLHHGNDTFSLPLPTGESITIKRKRLSDLLLLSLLYGDLRRPIGNLVKERYLWDYSNTL